MSGITPLIDTLLHQVLGRQGELSLQRALDQPVKPVSSGQGPRAVMGDASLDGRASTSSLSDLKQLPLPADGGRGMPRGEAPSSLPGSTQTHFSPAARTIADVLLRFPAPPSVMRPEAPLISSQETPAASAVATRLEASIRDSGLFYESHLKRWFQGEGTRQQLMNQPQMQSGPRSLVSHLPTSLNGAASASASASPAATLPASAPATLATALSGALSPTAPSAGSPAALAATPLAPLAAPLAGQGGVTILPNVPLIPVSHEQGVAIRLAGGAPHLGVTGSAAATTNTVQAPVLASPSSSPAPAGSVATSVEGRDGHQARAELSQAREVSELMANRPAREVVHESLQSLVRQQLEMLVMPTIRWEGDVWAGIFMALVINLPARDEGSESKQHEGEQDGGWRSDMQLEVPNLGAFNASLWFYRNVLSIDFTTDSTEVYQRIDAGLPTLEKRLSALDVQKVQLRARHVEAEAAHDNAG